MKRYPTQSDMTASVVIHEAAVSSDPWNSSQ